MPVEDRWRTRVHGKLVTLFDVRRTERYASHSTPDGHLYEYDLGGFWHTNLVEDEPRRELVDNPRSLPPGPLHHLSGCGCEVCRAG